MYFRPNYSKINSGEDWNNAREAEKEFLEVQGAFLRLEPDSHAGLVRAELLLPKHLREELKTKEYEYGFYTDIESETFPKGLNEDIVRAISKKKNEPEWMTEWRL